MSACGLDFGTSNSGLARPIAAGVALVALEGDATSLPSAIFFASEPPLPTFYGRAAVREYLEGTPGRLMRSLKSLLGSSLIEETTAMGDRNIRFTDVVALYLRTLRARAAQAAGESFDDVVLGRPVRFVDDDAQRDRQAQDTLARCARAAGFRHVEFQLEPIAAAFDYERTIAREEAVLVIDVGGGTADFSVIRLAPERRNRSRRDRDVLANDGVHIAGTDFDSRLNLAWTMPALGYRTAGPKGLRVPSLVYFDLSTWHRINLLYAPKFLGTLRELQAFFGDPVLYRRLVHVIDERLGHELLGDTEAAKIALSDAAAVTLDLARIEAGLAVPARARRTPRAPRRPAGEARRRGDRDGGRRRTHARARFHPLFHGRLERNDGAARGVLRRISRQPHRRRRPLRQRGERPRARCGTTVRIAPRVQTKKTTRVRLPLRRPGSLQRSSIPIRVRPSFFPRSSFTIRI